MRARDVLLWIWGAGGSAAVISGVAVLAIHDSHVRVAGDQVPGSLLSPAVQSLVDPNHHYGSAVACDDTKKIIIGGTTDCVIAEPAATRPVAHLQIRWADDAGHFTVRVHFGG